MPVSNQVPETTEAPADDRCEECFATHGQIPAGHRCTTHGHGFSRYAEKEVEYEEFWRCPEDGCTEGRWYS